MERTGTELFPKTLEALAHLSKLIGEDVIPPPQANLIKYINMILKEKIPTRCPKIPDLMNMRFAHYMHYMVFRDYREQCIKKGLWTLIDKTWTKKLATWIDNRCVLEVMAGGGWLAKALKDHGVKIIATDQLGEKWATRHTALPKWPDLPVHRMGARKAISHYNSYADILLVSWPPYAESEIVRVMDAWGTRRPVIYIGEIDGCNAGKTFFDHFVFDEKAPKIKIQQWPGIHDHLLIGRWRR